MLLAGPYVARRPAAHPGRPGWPGQLLRQGQQRVDRAVHHPRGKLGEPGPVGPRHRPEQFERLPGRDSPAFGNDADRLFHPHPGGQGVLELADCDPQSRRFRAGIIGHRAPTVYLKQAQAISSDLVKEGHG